MSEKKEELPVLLHKLDQEFEELKRNPSVEVTWASSDANTAIQVYLSSVSSTNELNEARIQLLGKSGRFSMYLSELGRLPQDIRPKIAAQVNPVKSANLHLIEEKAKILYGAELDAQ